MILIRSYDFGLPYGVSQQQNVARGGMAKELKRAKETGSIATVLQCGETGELLKSAAFNCIALGQWEAACACLHCLARAEGGREGAEQLLKTLALDPTSFW